MPLRPSALMMAGDASAATTTPEEATAYPMPDGNTVHHPRFKVVAGMVAPNSGPCHEAITSAPIKIKVRTYLT
jgi:hypothetical protein